MRLRRRLKLLSLSLALVLCATLTGCDMTQEPENQAYALLLSIDKTTSGLIELGVTLPVIGSEGGDAGSGPGGVKGSHENFFVLGSSFNEALDLLEASIPRALNMTQLNLIVVSQVAAQEPTFHNLVESLMLTNHLYSTSYVLISLGTAKDFLNSMMPMPGQRFSSGLATSIEHYAKVGYVTDQTLATIYFLMHSIYGDPAPMLAGISSADDPDLTLPPGMMGDALPGTLPREDSRNHELMGCALFNKEHMVGVLKGGQTRWLTTLTGQINSFNYMCQGHYLRLNMKSTPRATIDLSKSPIEITVTLNVLPVPIREMPDKAALRDQIIAELSELFSHCQSLGVEPFNYAEQAAKQFLTIDDFERFNWREKFQSAKVNFAVNFVGAYP